MPDYLKGVFLAVLLGLTGCGFQLKGSDASGLESVRLVGSSAAPATFRVVRDEMQALGVEVTSSADSSFTVSLDDESSLRRTVATTNVIDAAAYELRLELVMSIRTQADVLVDEATLVAERVYEIDRANLSGSFEEQNLLMVEMRRELAGKVMRRLETVARTDAGRTP